MVYTCLNAGLAAGACMMAGASYRHTHIGKGPEQWQGLGAIVGTQAATGLMWL